jgi:hypothetical protein
LFSTTAHQHRAALDTLKLLMNELCIPLFVLGTKRAGQALEADEHLNARFIHMSLAAWKVDGETRDLLAGIERMLPLRKPSNLSSIPLTRAIVRSTDGVMSRMVRLVNHAAIFSILDGVEHINEEMIAKAKEQVPPASVLYDEKAPPIFINSGELRLAT